ncbi:hypothetical protein RND71_022223 [Anisodus tanguticus]|uniref:CENP-V/GFA domain-containing protein n=1 Tax=Anisodus tanguticus TaxID=243964 RepID=A0AAE1VG01_9SOLA|nr:hypothetical protein RND71_022223 [Anisodus tanguticus]
MRRNTNFIVPSERFALLGDSKEFITTYTFGTHTAKHTFCKVCGVTSFYIPRSNPDGIAVTLRVGVYEVQAVASSSSEWMSSSAGVAFTPHVIHIGDVAEKLLAFAQQRPRALCILSANGAAHGYKSLVMIGDGATDLEARMPGGADLFVCYGGVHLRESVAAKAD